jgi:hypothetical protein
MISCGEGRFDLESFVECPEGFGMELSPPVRDHAPGSAVEPLDMLKEHQGYIFCCRGFLARDEVCHLGESVHYHYYAVIPLALGQFDDNIIGNFFPWSIGNAQKLKRNMLLMSLTPLTGFARIHVVIDLNLHGRPVVVVGYQFQSAHISLMPIGWRIVEMRHHLLFQLWVIRDENATLEE